MTQIDFSKVVEFSNGVRVLNCTPHIINFLDGEAVVEVAPCGATLKAAAVEEPVGKFGNAELVETVFQASPEGLLEINTIAGETDGVLVVGSIISAQAYPGRVVGMTPAPGFERVAPTEKRMSISKFTVFSA